MSIVVTGLPNDRVKGKLTFTRRFRAAFEFKKANSTAAESISERFVQSGKRASSVVKSCEGP